VDNEKIQQLSEQAGAMLDEGYHCSEAMLWAGRQLFPQQISPEMQRLTTPFAGGIGGTNEDICGALAGAIMVIGAGYGRQDGISEDSECQNIAQSSSRYLKKNSDTPVAAILKKIGAGNLVRKIVIFWYARRANFYLNC